MNATIEALFIGPTAIVAFLIFVNFRKVNVKANLSFGFFVLCIFLIQLNGLFEKINLFNGKAFISDFINLSSYIVAPLFYLSISNFTAPNTKWKITHSLHFLFPFLIFLLTILTLFVDNNPPENEEQKTLEANVGFVFSLIFCAQVFAYCIAAFLKINKYQKNLAQYSSNTEAINLSWLKKVVVSVLIIALFWLLDILFQLSEASLIVDTFGSIFYFLGVCYIAYHSIKQNELFPFSKEDKKEIEAVLVELEKNGGERKRKLISDEKLLESKQLLLDFMQQEKPYLDYEISLIKLASQFKTSPHVLSYIINMGFNETFFQFINRYRVEAAKAMLLDSNMKHLTLIGIAFEAGFNSKTVFNTTFKKITGKTPSEFKNNPN